jgi:hypothetical protein
LLYTGRWVAKGLSELLSSLVSKDFCYPTQNRIQKVSFSALSQIGTELFIIGKIYESCICTVREKAGAACCVE